MNDQLQQCAFCGSRRLVIGRLKELADEDGGLRGIESPARFQFPQGALRSRPLMNFLYGRDAAVVIRQHGGAILCLQCGRVDAVLSVDQGELEQCVASWCTGEVQALLANGEES